MSESGVQGDNRSAKLGGSAESSAIITGDRSTATITITNYYGYREAPKVEPVESTEGGDENLPCPYRGLFHFGPDDAEFFFGRDVFIEELFKATQNRNFIPLLGASGSGKSSVVLAGLVPRLQQEGHWLFTHFRPGSDPFHALALALVPLYTQNLDATDKIIQARKLSKSLGDGEIPLNDVFAQIHQNNPTHRILLIADQFEEIYTLCADREIRHRFLDSLLASFQSLSSQSQYNRVLVATMRADFLGNALLYRPFGDVLKNDIKLSSMNHDELSQVISKPAEKLGVTFEVGLVERILDDVEHEPGNLPLLEFALTELWKQRRGKRLTHAAYQTIGKVQGALARQKAGELLKLTIISADKIEDSNHKAKILSAIAETYGKLNQPQKAGELLKLAIISTDKIESTDKIKPTDEIEDAANKAKTLSAIAEAIGKLNQPQKASELLKLVITSADKIEDSANKAKILSAIAEATANMKNWGQALKIAEKCPSDDCKVESLAKILTVHAQQQHLELKEK